MKLLETMGRVYPTALCVGYIPTWLLFIVTKSYAASLVYLCLVMLCLALSPYLSEQRVAATMANLGWLVIGFGIGYSAGITLLLMGFALFPISSAPYSMGWGMLVAAVCQIIAALRMQPDAVWRRESQYRI